MKITMFTKTICPNCKLAKQQLSYVPVPIEIEEVNIETYEEDYYCPTTGDLYASPLEYITEKLESMSTPTFLFEDGTIVRGFEMGQIQEALGL